MTDKTQLWRAMQQAMNAVATNLAPAVRAKLEDTSIEIQNLFPLGIAYEVRPEPIELKHLRNRDPYSVEQNQLNAIQRLRDAGLVDENDVITQTAYDEYQSLIDAQDELAKSLNLMSESKLDEVVNYLKRAHDVAIDMDDMHSFQIHAGQKFPGNAVHLVYELIARFAALRDDVHIKAWQHLDADGHTYEAASLVWDGTATNAATLMEARQNRGYEESDWQATLDKLVEQGWLNKNSDDYAATEEWNKIRSNVEVKTDELFYSIFADFSDDEIEHLLTLLKEVQAKFTPEPEAS